MTKNKPNKELDLLNVKNSNDETLEISPTGYGLESVAEDKNVTSRKHYNPSCGGL